MTTLSAIVFELEATAIPTALVTAVDTGRPGETLQPSKGASARVARTRAPRTCYRFVVMSIERERGTIRWERTAREEIPHEGHHGDHGYASASPVTDGRYVWVSFGSRGIYCYDLDGNLHWKRDLGEVVAVDAPGAE